MRDRNKNVHYLSQRHPYFKQPPMRKQIFDRKTLFLLTALFTHPQTLINMLTKNLNN